MQNVLADLALETEAATLLALPPRARPSTARAARRAASALLARILTPDRQVLAVQAHDPRRHARRWSASAATATSRKRPLARLYREAPLNGIWEGSGNVICLDVLRSVERAPESLAALLEEIGAAAAGNAHLKAALARLQKEFGDRANLESRARRLVELAATALQASLMLRHSDARAAEAFCASRLGNDWGRVLGTLPAGTGCAALAERLRLQ